MQVSGTSGSSITELMAMLQQLYHSDSSSTASSASTVDQNAATATAVSNSIAASGFLSSSSSLSSTSLMALLQTQSFDDASTTQTTGQATDATFAKWASTADSNGDGLISKTEFEAAVPSNITAAEADQLFASIDTAGTGTVSVAQLRQGLAAAIAAGPAASTAPTGGTDRLFAALDTNGDGTITQAEFEADAGSGITKAEADAVFAQLDLNGDGSITPGEFAEALVGGGTTAAAAGTSIASAATTSQDQALEILSQLDISSTPSSSSSSGLLDGTFTGVLDTLDANQQSTASIQGSTDNLASLLEGLG